MRPITRVYVMSHPADLWMARISVASIRHWYPEIPITLWWNSKPDPYSTARLEQHYGVSVEHSGEGQAWNSLIKLDLLTRIESERYLYLDADTVMLGPLLDRLAQHDADFVVCGESCAPFA